MDIAGGDISKDRANSVASTSSCASSEPSKGFTVHICPTTGGQFDIELSENDNVEDLRKKISRHLQTPKERLKLLRKETVLTSGSLSEQNIVEGSRLTLLPAVESGFSSTVQGTQQSIIQAIESLSDPQIDDFLSGRLPLTLALRVGDHMMFVQLQLEQSPAQANSVNTKNHIRPNGQPHSHRESGSTSYRHRNITPVMGLPSRRMCHGQAINHMSNAPTDLSQLSTTATTASSPRPNDNTSSVPAPKIPKLSPEARPRSRSRMPNTNEMCEAASTEMGLLYNQHNHHASQSDFFNAMNPVMCDARTNSYYPYPTHSLPSEPLGSNPSHLHKLVTAYTSLENSENTATAKSKDKQPNNHPTSSKEKAKKRPAQPDGRAGVSYNHHQHFNDANSMRNSYIPAAIIHDALRRQAMGSSNFIPPVALLPSMYAEFQAAAKARAQRHDGNKRTPGQSRSSASSSNSAGSSSSSRHSRHRKSGSKSSKIVSSVGSISSHSSGASGNRVVRQMQRLRRLCSSHQQCVAYSNRELASEISSIVHAAKHSQHQRTDHRRSHKMCRECVQQNRPDAAKTSPSTSSTSSKDKGRTAQVSGACIDSFTTHGPGIFSGTFSGSLHPSIQDSDGKPRRDPKTILQILTDLLAATDIYQGQLGVGLLPQLFKDQVKTVGNKGSTAAKTEVTNANQKPIKVKGLSTGSKVSDLLAAKPTTSQRNGPYVLTPNTTEVRNSAVFKATSSVATVPVSGQKFEQIGTNQKYTQHHAMNRYHMVPQLPHCPYYRQHFPKCARHSVYQCKHKLVGMNVCCCCASASRKQSKAQQRSKRLMQDNEVTRSKVKLLKDKMKERRAKRMQKRADVLTQNKKNVVVEENFIEEQTAPVETEMDTTVTITDDKVEVQLDRIANYSTGEVKQERFGDEKDVNGGETVETVTV